MTGDIGKKARAAFLALIMVTSVMVAGVAFTGSAAATESTANGGSASFYTSEATSGAQGVTKHVVRVNISGTSVANSDFSSSSGSAGSFSIEYSDGVNLDGSRTGDDFANTGNTTVSSTFADDDSIDIYVGGNELDTSTGSGDDALVSRSGSNITVDFSEDSLDTGSNGDASDDDIITVVLRSESADASDTVLDNPSSSTTVDVTLNDGNSNQKKFTGIAADMDDEAPITAELNSGDEYYYTLGDAVSALGSSNTEVIDVQEDLYLRDDPSQEVFGGNPASNTVDQDDTVINGSSTVYVGGNGNVFGSYDGGSEYLIDVGNADSVTIEDLTFNDTQGLEAGTGLQGAITSSSGAHNDLVIDDATFQNFGGNGPLLDLATSGAPDSINVTNNVIDVGTTDVISLDEITQTDGDLTQINNNEITYDGGANENAIIVDANENSGDDDGEVKINGNEIYGESGSSQDAVELQANSNEFESNVTIDDFYAENVTTAIQDVDELDSDEITISNFEIVDATNGIDLDVSSSGSDNTKNVTIEDTTGSNVQLDASGTGINIETSNDIRNAVEIKNVILNNSNKGIVTSGISGGYFNVSNSDITHVDDVAGIEVNGGVGQSINVDTVTVTDANPNSKDVKAVDVNNAGVVANITGLTATDVDYGVDAGTSENNNQDLTVSESTFTRAGSAGVVIDFASKNGQTVQIDNNEFINGSTGLSVDSFDADGSNTESYNVHFNSFEENDDGVVVDADNMGNTPILNVTFNDFVDNANTALDTDTSGDVNNGQVTATFNWWGDATGADANQAGSRTYDAAYGYGDNVTLSTSGDASVFPFLTQSIDDYSADQLAGDQPVLIENPAYISNADGKQQVYVAVLDESEGITDDRVFVTAADFNTAPNGESLDSYSDSNSAGTASPRNVFSFDVNTVDAGNYNVETTVNALDTSTDSITQEVVESSPSGVSATEVAGNTTIGSDGVLNVSATALNSNNGSFNQQDVSVSYNLGSDGNAAGVTLDGANQRTVTANNGTATVGVIPAADFSPNQEFTLDVTVAGEYTDTLTFDTTTGSANSLDLELNGQDTQDESGITVNTTHTLSANITDTGSNAIVNQDVTFEANASVFDGSSSTTANTGDDGNASVSFTLPESVGTTELSASGAGRENSTNITTQAAAVSQLGFASDTRSFAPGATPSVTVEVQDEFGNYNSSATVDDDATITTSDSDVISISSDSTNSSLNSANTATFDLSTGSGDNVGDATLNVTAADPAVSAVEDTFTVAEPDSIDLTVAHNVVEEGSSGLNQANITAQFTVNGEDLAASNENISVGRDTGSSAELNQSDDFVEQTGSDGSATFVVNGTSPGETDFVATAENYSISTVRGSVTVTTTGAADDLSIQPETNSVAAGETANVTATFLDTEERVVPRSGVEVQMSAGDGQIETTTNDTFLSNGQYVSTFTYNATNEDGTNASGDVELTAQGGGQFSSTTINVQEPSTASASVTFNDTTVTNGTETVTVDNANYTLADGTAGDYVVVAHVVSDEYDGGLSSPVGYSSNVTGAASDITVDLNASEAQGDALDTLTANTTLRAMLHETSSSSAFGPSLGLATDDATITVEEDGTAISALIQIDLTADRDVQTAKILFFSETPKSDSYTLLPHHVYNYTRTHNGELR